MKVTSKAKRIIIMIIVGLALSMLLLVITRSPKLASSLTAIVLFFLWPLLGGKWY